MERTEKPSTPRSEEPWDTLLALSDQTTSESEIKGALLLVALHV